MIGYIEGKVLDAAQDGILLLAGHVGYEILLPMVDFEKISSVASDDVVSLYIYYHQTERQPKPVLIGFHSQDEKSFFQQFISVDAIGPMKAVKAMEKPVGEIARAIENGDVDFLSALKGIGKRTAQKIVATLQGKVSRFALPGGDDAVDVGGTGHMRASGRERDAFATVASPPHALKGISQQVVDVLVEQLGYTAAVARRMVAMALEKNASIDTPEALFDAVLKQK